MIIDADKMTCGPEAVARRSGQLTEEDKRTLLSQGVPPDCWDELDIVKGRYKLDKKKSIVEVKSGASLNRDEIMKSVQHFLTTTQKDGGRFNSMEFPPEPNCISTLIVMFLVLEI